MITYEVNIGRLGEVRFSGTISEGDVLGMIQCGKEILTRIPERLVLCVDVTLCRILPATIADMVTNVMRRSNPRVERLAFLVSPGRAIALLQVARMIRETNHPLMRSFREASELQDWLGEVLTPIERERLRVFLEAGQ